MAANFDVLGELQKFVDGVKPKDTLLVLSRGMQEARQLLAPLSPVLIELEASFQQCMESWGRITLLIADIERGGDPSIVATLQDELDAKIRPYFIAIGRIETVKAAVALLKSEPRMFF